MPISADLLTASNVLIRTESYKSINSIHV